jgi:long-chain acyl-CoA synthetase
MRSTLLWNLLNSGIDVRKIDRSRNDKMWLPLKNLGDAISVDAASDIAAIIEPLSPSGERIYNYGGVRRMAAAVARGLMARGLRAGDRVAILSANRSEYLFAFLGALQAGMVSVPVNHKLSPATIDFILNDCDARIAIGDEACLSLAGARCTKISFDSMGENAFRGLIDEGRFESVRVDSETAAMILYTSGSTGRPKGVVLSHRSQLSSMKLRAGLALPAMRTLVAAPLYHMNGLVNCQSALSRGDTIVLLPQFTAVGYIEAAARHRVSSLTAVPTMIAMMLRETELLSKTDLSHVDIVRMASAPLTQALIDQTRAVFPKAAIFNGYGTTEGGPVVFGLHPEGFQLPDTSVGYPLNGVEWRLIRDGREVDDEGALELRSECTMSHYLNLPEMTSRAITEDGFYRTKDIFKRDKNGFFYFVGRTDDMFVCGGENIYPGDIEAMLERHPEILQAAVVPMTDELKGKKPVAFVVRAPNSSIDEEGVRVFARANGPAYQHPRRVAFVDELPLAGTNKIDKAALIRAAHLFAGAQK